MARKMANKAAVETIRHRLGRSMTQFSEDLGYSISAYADMVRTDAIPFTAGLAAEALSRRQAPGAADELTYLTRIVRGVPVITLLDQDVRTMVLDGERYLLIPVEDPRQPTRERQSVQTGNGSLAPAIEVGADLRSPVHITTG